MKTLSTNGMIAILSAILLFLPSCKVAEKALRKGDYDKTIDLTVSKLHRNQNKSKQVLLLEEAFAKVNKRDLDRIAFLNKEGQPERHQQILDIYYRISKRQNKISPLLPLYIEEPSRQAKFEMINTNEAIVATKKKAAEFLYVKGKKLLAQGDKHDARRAFDLLTELRKMYPSFRDVDTQIHNARVKGTTHVRVKSKNSTGTILPSEIDQNLKRLDLSSLNQQWLSFYTNPGNNAFDYELVINLKRIEVSPEHLTERLYKAEKEIKDGWEYAKTEDGRVMVDSLGKKVKQDLYRMIFADVVEVSQTKQGRLHATIDIINTASRQIVKSYPVSSNADFSNIFATFHGNPQALDCDTEELTKRRFSPFPSSEQLAIQASQGLKASVLDVVVDNKRILLD